MSFSQNADYSFLGQQQIYADMTGAFSDSGILVGTQEYHASRNGISVSGLISLNEDYSIKTSYE